MGYYCSSGGRFKFEVCQVGNVAVSQSPTQHNYIESDDTTTQNFTGFAPVCCFASGIDLSFDCATSALSISCH